MADEEKDDFKTRLNHVLTTPDAPLPAIDPEGWVTSRKYSEQLFEKKQEEFLTERHRSVRWLQSLKDPKWDNAYAHPKFGPLSAKMFLCNWVAHDMHHIRQINELQHHYLLSTSGDPLQYAGKW